VRWLLRFLRTKQGQFISDMVFAPKRRYKAASQDQILETRR